MSKSSLRFKSKVIVPVSGAVCSLPYGKTPAPGPEFYGAAGSTDISSVSAFQPRSTILAHRPEAAGHSTPMRRDSPAPASTFYHLVGAIVTLDTALRSSA